MHIGQEIIIDHKLYRDGEGDNRFWSKKEFEKPKTVYVVGIRTISDGEVIVERDSWSGQIEAKYFLASKYFKALLVVESLRTKPFLTSFTED